MSTSNPHTHCGSLPHTLISQTYPVTTGHEDSVTVVQRPRNVNPIAPLHGRHPHVHGTISVRPSSSEPGISLSVTANDPSIDVDVSFEGQTLALTTPQVGTWAHQPCVEVIAVVNLPPGSELDKLSLHAAHLNVTLEEDLSLQVSEVSIGSVPGPVHVPEGSLASAHALSLTSVSGPIDAEVPVAEDMHTETTSGGIRLRILAPDSYPEFKSSKLKVSSVSGNVDVKGKGKLPQLKYTHSVSSISGRVEVALPFWESVVKTTSGRLSADLTPLLVSKGSPSVQTNTLSGNMDVTISEPADGKLDALESKHESMSGGVKVRYPSSWAGNFKAETFSGDVEVRGKDVEVGRGKGRKEVSGRKGDGKSRAGVKSFSGDVLLVIGEE